MRFRSIFPALSLLGLLIPFSPAAAAALSGDAGAGLSSATGASVQAHASANLDIAPIVVTRQDTDATETAPAPSEGATGTDAAASSDPVKAAARAVVAGDAKVSSVSLSPKRVALSYRAKAMLFGFIPVTVPVTIAVAATGTTTVAYPWYSFLLATDQVGLSIRAQAAAANEMPVAGVDADFSQTAEMRLLDSLHAALESETDTDGTATLP